MSGDPLTPADQNGARTVAEEIAARIQRHGSIRFDEFVELALYHPGDGFFSSGGGAGRAGADFLTSPEVGPLFGAVVARYLDARWDEMGRPDPFVVVEAAAGRGALAIAVLAAAPRCAAALRYVLVERSDELRERQREHLTLVHPFEVLGPVDDPDSAPGDRDARPAAAARGRGPLVCSLPDMPAESFDGVVLANELLDNLPFRLLERTDRGWSEVRVTADDDGALVELLADTDALAAERAERIAPDVAPGSRIPLQEQGAEWLRDALSVLRSGSVLVIDYASGTVDLAGRSAEEWIRTYRSHERGTGWLDAPGSQDVTCEVAVDQLEAVAEPVSVELQAAWLRRWGIEELVEEGRRIWAERAAAPDLAAMRARSRVAEAEALTDESGLGAFQVMEWRRSR